MVGKGLDGLKASFMLLKKDFLEPEVSNSGI